MLDAIVVVATILGGAAALWLFWDKLVSWWTSRHQAPRVPDEPARSKPRLVFQHDKPQDTEPWPGGGGYNVKFRVLNDSEVRAKKVGARIRSLEFLEAGKWRAYGHDYAEVPLATRDGSGEFSLSGGDENSVLIARRPTDPTAPIQLCYAKAGTPDNIPLKPAWRVGLRLVCANSPPQDADFQLRVSADGSLVGKLLGDNGNDELSRRKARAEYIGELYAEAVELRNHAASLRVLDAKSAARMDELQELLANEMRQLAPEQAINLDTLNTYKGEDHPQMVLQDPKRTLEFSEFLRRVQKVLENYRQ